MLQNSIASITVLALTSAALAGPGVVVGGPKFGNSPQSWNAPIKYTTFPAPAPVVRPPNWCGTPTPRHYVGGGGLRVDGRYRDDKWKIGFHLGDGSLHRDDCFYPVHPYYGYGNSYRGYRVRGWYDGNSYAGYNAPYYSVPVSYPALVTVPPGAYVAPPAPQPASPPAPLTILEQAEVAISGGEVEGAIALYRKHLEEFHQDSETMRALGVALLAAGRLPDGIAVIREAYTMNPSLADTPYDARVLGRDASGRLTDLVRRTVQYANAGESGSPWLAVAMLMQSQGRDRIALANLLKGVDLGLDDAIVQPLSDALRRQAFRP